MPSLSGDQAGRLSEALRDAFSPDELAQLLYFALDKRMEDITLAGSYETLALRLDGTDRACQARRT